MKKGWMALCAAMLLMLCAGTALADGQATITRQLAQTYDYGDVFFTYYFAEVQNTGDAPIVLDGGKLELYNAEGGTIYSAQVYNCYPSVLGPGEIGYVREYTNMDTPDAVASYRFDLSASPASTGSVSYLTCESSFEQKTLYEDQTSTTITARLTNPQQETLRGIMTVYALYDATGNILFVDTLSATYLGLPAGSTVELSTVVDGEIEATWNAQGVAPASAKAIAYVILD